MIKNTKDVYYTCTSLNLIHTKVWVLYFTEYKSNIFFNSCFKFSITNKVYVQNIMKFEILKISRVFRAILNNQHKSEG